MNDNDTEYVEELIKHDEISAALDETSYNAVIDIAIGDRPKRNLVDHRRHFVVYDVEVGYVVRYETANYDETDYQDVMEVPADVVADWLLPAIDRKVESGKEPEEIIDVQTVHEDFEEFVGEVVDELL